MAVEPQTQENNQYEEASQENSQQQQETEQEEYAIVEDTTEQRLEPKQPRMNNQGEDRSSFIHGLAVGLGIGCIATFVIVWIAIFFTPMMPTAVTYETLLSIFIYPLIYLLAVGLIALTAGIVREYYSRKSHF